MSRVFLDDVIADDSARRLLRDIAEGKHPLKDTTTQEDFSGPARLREGVG